MKKSNITPYVTNSIGKYRPSEATSGIPISGTQPSSADRVAAPVFRGVPDSFEVLQIYQTICTRLLQAYAYGNRRKKWTQDGRSLPDTISEEIYIHLRSLRDYENINSPLYGLLQTILGDFLVAGMEYSRGEFLDLCGAQPLVPTLWDKGDEIERLQKSLELALEIKNPAGKTRRIRRTHDEWFTLASRVEQALHSDPHLSQEKVAAMFGFARGCFRNRWLHEIWTRYVEQRKEVKELNRRILWKRKDRTEKRVR